MKKMTKGAIVTGLGVALLLGGGGTLATWNAEQVATEGFIATGSMGMTPGESVWTSNLSNGTIATDETISDYKIVPEEELTFAQDLTITTEGNLEAELSLNTGSLSGDLLDNLTLKNFTVHKVEENGTTSPVNAFTNRFDATAPVSAGTYKVSATVRFDATGQDAMDTSLNLSTLKYVLTQKTPTPVN